MPSFDTVLEADFVEVKNAVDNTAKEIGTRFDFKGTSAGIELKDKEITLFGDADFQLQQVEDILRNKLTKRNVDVRFLDIQKAQKIGGDKVKQLIKVKNGIESELVPVDGYRAVATIEGCISDLLGSPEHAAHERSFVRARVTDQRMTVGAMERLRQRFPHVLELEWVALAEQRHADRDHVKGRSVADIVRDYVNDTWNDKLDEFGTEFYEQGLENVLKGDVE